MSLLIKPPSWGHCTTNYTGTPPAIASLGTTFTPGATNGDGSSVAVLTNVTHDVEYLVIGFSSTGQAATNTSTLVDILVDPAGGTSWASDPLINDLLAGWAGPTGSGSGVPYWYHFPIWLKSGHSIGVRARQTAAVPIAAFCHMFAYGGNANPSSWWCGQSVESIATDAANSKGTNHTAGNSGAFSSWTNLGSTLSKPCGALQFAVHGASTDTTTNNIQYFYEFGVGSTRIGPPLFRTITSSETGFCSPQGINFCSLPAATQLQVRGTASGTAEVLDVAAYAVM